MSSTLPEFLQLARKKRQSLDERMTDGRTIAAAAAQAGQQPAAAPSPSTIDGLPMQTGTPASPAELPVTPQRDWLRLLPPITTPSASAPALAPAPAMSGTGKETPESVSPTARLQAQINEELARPVKDRNGRLKSSLKELARNAAQAFIYGGWPAAVRGAAVGGITGAIHPERDEEREQQKHLHKWQQELGLLRDNEHEELTLDEQRARINATNANADYTRARPDIEANKRADVAAQRERNAVLANLRLYKGQKLDATNPTHAALLQRAANAGIEVDPDGWNSAGSNLAPVDVVDPNNPTQKRRQYFNKATGELTDVGQTGYVQPVKPSGMTEAQEHTDADRDASRTETHRHNVAGEAQGERRIGQGDERIGIARQHAGRGGVTQRQLMIDQQKASTLARQLEEEKAKAAHPPAMINGQPTSEEYRRGYTAKHLGLARAYMRQLQQGYSHVYEAGDGDGGFPYAKPRADVGAVGAQPQAGAYAGHRFSRSQLPEIRRRLGVGSDAEAERIITHQGGVFY